MSYYETLCEMIASQQKGREGTDVFCAGEQLKEICRGSEEMSEIVVTDLEKPAMSIEMAVHGIRDFAAKHKVDRMGFCGPMDAERILRNFYGLPDAAPYEAPTAAPQRVNLFDFI